MLAHVLLTVLAAASTTGPARGEVKPAAAAAVVRQSALPVATGVRATLGPPACPSGVTDRVGAVFQCTVPIGDATVPFLVRIGPTAMTASQHWAVIPAATVAVVAGAGARCGTRKVVTGPPGSAVTCTVAGRTVLVRITSLSGALERVV